MPYNPSLHTSSNKSYGVTGLPIDARSFYYDEVSFIYRPYNSTTEVLSYLVGNQRRGNFSIFINISTTVGSNTTVELTEWWWKDGITDNDLVKKGVAAVVPTTASNGLTKVGDNIKLGGVLTESTVITSSDGNLGGYSSSFKLGSSTEGDPNFDIYSLVSTIATRLFSDPLGIYMTVTPNINTGYRYEIGIDNQQNGLGPYIADSVKSRGLMYRDDYSIGRQFPRDDNWIPNAKWVIEKILNEKLILPDSPTTSTSNYFILARDSTTGAIVKVNPTDLGTGGGGGTTVQAIWGSVGGTLSNQTDLVNFFVRRDATEDIKGEKTFKDVLKIDAFSRRAHEFSGVVNGSDSNTFYGTFEIFKTLSDYTTVYGARITADPKQLTNLFLTLPSKSGKIALEPIVNLTVTDDVTDAQINGSYSSAEIGRQYITGLNNGTVYQKVSNVGGGVWVKLNGQNTSNPFSPASIQALPLYDNPSDLVGLPAYTAYRTSDGFIKTT